MSETVSVILEILKYTVPSGIVFATAFFMLRQFLDEKRKMEVIKAKAASRSGLLPTRLQAFERILLFLERIEPTKLLVRVYKPAMSSEMLQRELSKTVREEFEHNLAQQLYVSNDCWNRTRNSKEAVLQLISLAAASTSRNAPGSELSNTLFEIVAKAGVSPTEASIEALKNEARQLL